MDFSSESFWKNAPEDIDTGTIPESQSGSSLVKQTILGMAGIALMCIIKSLSVDVQVVHSSGIGVRASKIPNFPWFGEVVVKR